MNFYDRIKETTTTVGVGTVTLAGAVSDYRPFSTINDGSVCLYFIDDNNGNWEAGSGTYNSNTLSRDTVTSSTNGGNHVNFGVGSKYIWFDVTASFLNSIPNANLANSSLTVTAGTGLTGGGSISLGSSGTVSLDLSRSNTWTGTTTFDPAPRSSGHSPFWSLFTPIDTGITANNQAIGIQFGGDINQASVTRTFVAGTVPIQNEVSVIAPTYAGSGGNVIFNGCSTLNISGAPIAGSLCTMPDGNNHTILPWAFSIGDARNPKFAVDGAGDVNMEGQLYIVPDLTAVSPYTYTYIQSVDRGGADVFDNTLGVFTEIPINITHPVVGAQFFMGGQRAITSNGSAVFGLKSTLGSYSIFYTGTGITSAGYFFNGSQGTNTTFASYPNGGGNSGISAIASANTVGTNIGCYGEADTGNKNYGVLGVAALQTKANAVYIGVAGYGLNVNATGPVQIGVYAALAATEQNYTGLSAAIVADNCGTSSPIFLGRANGVTKTSIDVNGCLRYPKRVTAVADATAITPNSTTSDIVTQVNTQALGTLTINADAGTPFDGQSLLLEIKSTNVQTLSFDSSYVAGTVALPTATTGGGKSDYYAFLYKGGSVSKWRFTGNSLGF